MTVSKDIKAIADIYKSMSDPVLEDKRTDVNSACTSVLDSISVLLDAMKNDLPDMPGELHGMARHPGKTNQLAKVEKDAITLANSIRDHWLSVK